MKITMIGKSGSGKTSFMAGLHEALNENKVGKFCIIPTGSTLSEVVAKSGKFDQISFKNNNYEFPDGTQKTTIWSFDLCYGNTPICELEWIDYRGGILDEMFSASASEVPTKNAEIEELLGHIAISNGVILFADSIMLSHYDNHIERGHHSGARVINRLLRLFSIQYPQRNLSVVIVLTKSDSDLIPASHKENDYKILVERGIEAFKEVAELCQTNTGRWKGGIVPVGAIGEGRVSSKKIDAANFKLPISVSSEVTAMPFPFNIEHPLFYTIGYTLTNMKDTTDNKIKYYSSQIESELTKSNILRDFWCDLTGAENPKETAKLMTDLLMTEINALNHIEPHIKPVLDIASKKIRQI